MGKPPETLISEGSPRVEVGVSVKPPGGVPVKPEVMLDVGAGDRKGPRRKRRHLELVVVGRGAERGEEQ